MNQLSPEQQVAAWLSRFADALDRHAIAEAAGMFGDECYWRDLVAFTWNIKTVAGRAEIQAMLAATLGQVDPRGWQMQEDVTEADGVISGWFSFDTSVARGWGHIRLKGDTCWTLLTTMVELKGFEEKAGRTREKGAQHGVQRDRKSWLERKTAEEAELGYSRQPYCLIIGGGQGGLALAARLRRLNVPAIVIEKNERSGDSWRNRYKSLCLHDPVWFDHLPYLPFPENWPVYSPKDKIGDWLEMYAKVMELNVWTSTECEAAAFDEATGEWTVQVNRNGQPVTLRPQQLVLATGMAGVPNMIDLPGADAFTGTLVHSSRYAGSDAFKGQHCVVIGSNNSAHDICADLWENGADVTMLQRSSTHVSKSDSLFELGTSRLYSEDALERGITTAKADLLNASVPYQLMPRFHMPVADAIRARDAEFYAKLTEAGFMLDFGDDGSGLSMKWLRRGSGYYIDVGASDLIIEGKVKLKSGVVVERVKARSVVLSDGTELPADLIVCATGYGSMNGWAAQLISQEVADKVGKCWGYGSDTTKDPGPWEGELRNMWKPTRQPNLWFQGGNLHQARHYSQFLALQIKARMEGLPTPVYGLAEVHHLS